MQIVNRQQKGIEINLFAVFQLLWKKRLPIIISGIAGALALLIGTLLFVQPKYAASVTLYANNSNSSDINTSITAQDITASVKLVDTYEAIILSDPVLDRVIELNDLQITGPELSNCIKIGSVNDTEVFKITVEYFSPEMAADIANSIADIAPVKIADIVDGCSVKIINNAKIPTNKSYPSNKMAVVIGAICGFAISVLVVLVLTLLDTRIKNEADLQMWDFPVLGVIPDFAEAGQSETYGYGKKGGDKREVLS